MIEASAHKLACFIGKNLNKTGEEVAVMEYGFIGMFQVFWIFLFSVVIGAIAGFLPETLVVFFSVGFLRRVIGGAHSEGLYSCLIISILMIASFSALTKYVLLRFVPVTVLIALLILIYAFTCVTVYRLAPVDSPNKPIHRPEKRKRLRREACMVLIAFSAFTVLSVIFRRAGNGIFLRLSTALAISTLWQACMLTKPGSVLIRSIDRLFHVGK